jgi:para-aminobenzoate synthetase/4-amino-4-deoxychorismate lyase
MNWHPLPAEVYALVEQLPASVLLESARPKTESRFSRLFVSPARVCEIQARQQVPGLFSQLELAIAEGHFAAGFFSYECGQAFEPKTNQCAPAPGQPLAWFGIYERAYVFDHIAGVFIGAPPPGLTPRHPPSARSVEADKARIEPTPGLNEQQFTERIEAIHEWIRAGDVYQLNFTFPLLAHVQSSSAALYAELGKRQPVDYGAFLHWQSGRHILSFSPELFFRVENESETRRITTQPMKGTARRGRTTAEDVQIRERLRNDPKNRSENVMIVDLLRNDLGRLCTFGSVHVQNLFAVERYPTLWQMTSTVAGKMRPEVGFHELFRALFPCGSITGAPKVRAMQLISELEAAPRGIYTGAIGYFSREQTVFNVAIRTLDVRRGNLTMGVGSGIVIDSNAVEEFRECQLKAEFLTQSSQEFSLIETMLWQDGFPLLEMHLDRLTDSADYFGFVCDRDAVRAALLSTAGAVPDQRPRRVRLLLDADGSTHIQHEAVNDASQLRDPSPALVCIASQRTSSNNRFLFHKTTHRPLYASALKAASEAGFSDVLFLNEREEVTEGAISNVFIEKDARWFTPPIDSGVLPGVYRRHLLLARPEIKEKVLHLADLESADAVYLTNAIRGLRQATIDWTGISNKAGS